jgi:hypothetical protein
VERQKLLNEFIACGQEISGIVSKYVEFLRLRDMIFNETEREPIESITDNLSIALGSLETAWEDVYAFSARLDSENVIRTNQ